MKRDKIVKMLGGKCVICGVTSELEIDHIIPRRLLDEHAYWTGHSYGGGSCASLKDVSSGNFQLLCVKCHVEKHDNEREENHRIAAEMNAQFNSLNCAFHVEW